jgi:predicted aspartyl protease
MGQPSALTVRGTTTPLEALWVFNISEGSHPKLTIKINNKPFKFLIDTGTVKIILRQEIPCDWQLIPEPQLLGIGCNSHKFTTEQVNSLENPDRATGLI